MLIRIKLTVGKSTLDLVNFASDFFDFYKTMTKKEKVSFNFNWRNSFFVFYISLMAIVSPFLVFPAIIMKFFKLHNLSDRWVNRIGRLYSRHAFFVFDIRVEVRGLEHLPKEKNICFVSNHQGLADIPLIVGYIPIAIGFIAKKELNKIPILNFWLKAMRCVMIDRSNARSAVLSINQAIANIKGGHPMVIFPEGTRSRSNTMGRFKSGSFKLVTGANSLVVPLTIDGTYKTLEERGTVSPADIKLTIHPVVDISKLSSSEINVLPEYIESIVRSAL